MQPSRRITVAVGLAMFVDAALYLAVLPLLPTYADRYGMSTLGAAVLVAAYPAATPAVSLAAIVLVPRIGGRRISLVSAALMLAATITFALAPSAAVLIAARFLQGVASGSIWTASMAWVTHNAPPGRRGRESGIVMGMLSAGSIAGPGVGALAAWIGVEPAFLLVAAVSAVALAWTMLAPAGRPVAVEPELVRAIVRAARQPLSQAALAVALIDPLAFGTIDLLVPLGLGRHGSSTAAIAAALAAGAVLGAVVGPIAGRLVDRHGAPRFALAAAATTAVSPLLLAPGPPAGVQLALLVVFSPVFAVAAAAIFPLASAGADAAGVAHVVVNGLQGAVWAVGFTAAPLAMGALASATSPADAFVVASCVCMPALVLLVHGVRAAARAPAG
jgi:MFS transporter, DHA1 family, solute carrier family 18 (vesicular amine transporter), member 1/2